MDMKEFINLYAANLLEKLEDHSLRIDSYNWNCCLCPLKELCDKISDNSTCGQFIQKNVTDGKEYKA